MAKASVIITIINFSTDIGAGTRSTVQKPLTNRGLTSALINTQFEYFKQKWMKSLFESFM